MDLMRMARLDEARSLVELALSAMVKVKVMNLEPQQRVDIQAVHRLLDKLLNELQG